MNPIPEANNPLLDFSGLPRFDAVLPEHVAPALDALLAQNRAIVAQLETPSDSVSWKDFEALNDAHEKLGRAWGVVSHLNSVADRPELREVYKQNLPKIIEFSTALGQNIHLFEKYKALRAGAEFAGLSPARKKIIENNLRGFRLGGAELPDDKKKRFAEIQERQAAISNRFSENVLDATNDYALVVDKLADLAGMPDDVIQAARTEAEKDGKTGYKFTLHFPSFYPILQFADQRKLRETIYRANVTKASELGAEKWDNSENIVEMLKLRAEKALLLGYETFAEVSLVPKMAQNPQQVKSFLQDLAKRARPYAEKDLAEVRTFAKTELGIDPLEAWDLAYASEKLRQQRYAFSAQEVKQYFPEPKVIEGLFSVAQSLFSVDIKIDSASAWHPDVKFYRIEKDGRLIGQFYLDLYARQGKRSGAWMNGARNRGLLADGLQTPVAYITCNFSEPVMLDGKTRPVLLTHEQAITLFHEFGHGLHHMLTEVDELGVAGISGVEWDAIELPSQFLENFCWEWDVLQQLTAHIDTGLPLPRSLFDKMLAAKNFQSGMQTLRNVEFSLCDMQLHHDFNPCGEKTVQQLIDEIRAEYAVVIPPAYNRFQHAFAHIFAGSYAAGYYSYKWAEVLSADAFSAFEEAAVAEDGNILSSATGRLFQAEILAVGGSRPALESFTAFRGREPNIDALLRRSGMASD